MVKNLIIPCQHFYYFFILLFFIPYLQFVIANSESVIHKETKTITTCISAERDALLLLKQGFIDDGGLLSSWSNEEDKNNCCQWSGVRCNNRTGHVTELDLSSHFLNSIYGHEVDHDGFYLEGKLSPSIVELRHLSYLNLSNHFRVGNNEPIPKFIGSLIQLEYLDLSYSNFNGIIPFELGNLSKLRYLNIGHDTEELSGDDNLMHSLSRLTSLIYLNMNYVNLSNATRWLSTITSLPSLSYVDLSECSIPTIPSSFHPSLINSSTSISTLILSSNYFEGPIPSMLGNMTLLTHLSLSFNQFEGVIPQSFGNLCHLQTLNLESNNFNKSLSEFVVNFYGCVDGSLRSLYLSYNQLQAGPVPYTLRNKTLQILDLESNNLSGNLPKFVANFSSLYVLDLSKNSFIGRVPDFTISSSLRRLELGNNKLSGTLSTSIGQLSMLEYLDISSNSLEGVISELHFFNLTKLNYLDLSFNNLTVELGSGWVPPFQLDTIKLSACMLGPKFPGWIRNQTNISYLDLSDNGIAEAIPLWFWNQSTTRLRFFNASSNAIIGVLPDFSSSFGEFPRIDLSSNFLEGPIMRFPPSSIVLDLSRNMFSELTMLSSIMYQFLSFLDLSHNLLSGGIHDQFFKNMTKLVILDLSHNKLSGKIPSSIGSLSEIQTIELQNNSFFGELPLSLKNCTTLEFLNLGENNLSGNIPSWVGESLSNLYVLIMRSNQFKGSIPLHLCHLTKLQLLDLSTNHLSGHIPRCFNNFTAMIQQRSDELDISTHYYLSRRDNMFVSGIFNDRAVVKWKGNKNEFIGGLRLLKSIDLSNNELTGEFPQGIIELEALVSLDLSKNKLHGVLPQGIGQLISLESLDLSRNQFSGNIPSNMSALHFLGFLDLAYNNFSGRIPLGTQLHSRNASDYIGNDLLCGPPLTRKCPGDHVQTQSPPSTVAISTESDEDEFYKWFYISSAVGFATSIWAVGGALLFYRPWRHAYFFLLGKIKDWLYVMVAARLVKYGLMQ